MDNKAHTLRAALAEIAGLAGACIAQHHPNDDRIIAEHIVEMREIARAALKVTEEK